MEKEAFFSFAGSPQELVCDRLLLLVVATAGAKDGEADRADPSLRRSTAEPRAAE